MDQPAEITTLNWLITGGCGFVGRMVIHTLLECGVSAGRIRVIDNFSVGEAKDL